MDEIMTVDRLLIKKLIVILSVAMCAFHIYTAATMPLTAMEQRSLHLGFAMVLAFLWDSLKEKKSGMRFVDYALAVASVAVNLHIFMNWLPISMRVTNMPTMDRVMGIMAIVLVLIVAARQVSIWLSLIAIAFIAYAFIGPHIKGYFWFPPIDLSRFLSYIYTGTEGIFGSCLEVSASTCFMYCVFGEVLLKLGAGKFLMDVATSFFGRIRGGASKVTVVACALFGMVSGSAAANVAATGSLTIPMMKNSGYTDVDAGSICAAAATGSTIMPPVMGSAAFVIAQMVNVSYGTICVAAFVPAVLFYIALFLMADLRTARYGLKALSKEEIPQIGNVMKEGWHFLIGIVLLIVLLVGLQWSPSKSAFWSIVTLIIADTVKRLVTRKKLLSRKDLTDICVNSAKGALMIAAACACAGIIVGVFSATSLNLRLSSILMKLAGGQKFLLLLYAAIGAILLGMGLPVLSVYLILAIVVAPALIKMGIPMLAAHMFLFFFGTMAGITPPVGATFYVSAGIAHSDAMKTGLDAFKLSAAGYLIPFVFAFDQSLFLQGNPIAIVWAVVTCMVGIVGMSFGLEGYIVAPINVLTRAFLIVCAILTVIPEMITTLIGLAGILVVVLFCWTGKKKKLAQA